MPLTLTDEQQDFVDAIRDFAPARVRHPRAARRADRRRPAPAQPGALRARWPSSAGSASRSPRSTAASGGGAGRHVPLPRGDRPRPGRRSAASASRCIVAGAYERFGTEEQKQEMLGGIVRRRRRGDRDVRAGGRAPTSARCTCKAERENGGYVVNGQKTWISEAHIADHILLVCRTDSERRQARGPDDAQRPDRRRRASRSGRSRRWAARIVNDVFFTDCVVARRAPARRARARLDAADGRASTSSG